MGGIVLAVVATVLAAEADTVVVCPPALAPALGPWIAHREAQGHRLTFLSNAGTADTIRSEIRKLARAGTLRNILLVGDALPAGSRDPELRARCIPAHFAPAKVNIHWGSEPEIATDNWYADLDDDQTPDLTIGRLTADNPDELSQIVGKILAYESASSRGHWLRRINFVAGVGGFGALADSVLEGTTKRFLVDGIPASYVTNMTYGSWRSPFCPNPRHFHEAALARFNEGCLFWVYIGHGQRTALDRIQVPGGTFPILDSKDVPKLNVVEGAPIAIFLACYTGAYDYQRDCLAEELLRHDGGPVAVLSGSRVTMPYAMAVFGTAMMDQFFEQRRPTLGEVVLNAKRQLVESREEPGADAPIAAGPLPPRDDASSNTTGSRSPANRSLLDALAAAISPAPELLAEERREHLLLFNLLGDPLLRLQHPAPFSLEVAEKVAAGEQLEIRGQCPIGGRCIVELTCRRDRLKTRPPVRTRYDSSPGGLAAFDDTYRDSNDRRFTTFQLDFAGGDFRTQLLVPSEARGECHVLVHLAGADGYALGAADVLVQTESQIQRNPTR